MTLSIRLAGFVFALTAAGNGIAADNAPRPGEVKRFKDWAVGCDNGLRCTMASLNSDASEDWPPVTLNLARMPGPNGRFSLDVENGKAGAISVDGHDIGDNADAIAAAFAHGHVATMAGGRQRISLNGASAALRYIDAMQGRAGGVTAIVAKGLAAAAAVRQPPVLPIVPMRPLRPSKTELTPTQLAAMRRLGECEAPSELPAPDSDIAEAGGGQRIVVLPCSPAPYNPSDAVFVLEGGKIAPARFDAPVGFEGADDAASNKVHEVVGGGFANGVLVSFTKGRGLGDCGVQQSFAWDGARFRLIDQAEMPDCRGNIAFITTWRARTRR